MRALVGLILRTCHGIPAVHRRVATQRHTRADVASLLGRSIVIRPKQPALMSPAARVSELGGVLAAGYRRLVLSRQNSLDEPGNSERSCASVNSTKSKKAREVQ